MSSLTFCGKKKKTNKKKTNTICKCHPLQLCMTLSADDILKCFSKKIRNDISGIFWLRMSSAAIVTGVFQVKQFLCDDQFSLKILIFYANL